MITLSTADLVVSAGLFFSVAMVIYHSGRLAARVDSLEAWRSEMNRTLDQLHNGLRRIESLIKDEPAA